jgi:hypothetical protein
LKLVSEFWNVTEIIIIDLFSNNINELTVNGSLFNPFVSFGNKYDCFGVTVEKEVEVISTTQFVDGSLHMIEYDKIHSFVSLTIFGVIIWSKNTLTEEIEVFVVAQSVREAVKVRTVPLAPYSIVDPEHVDWMVRWFDWNGSQFGWTAKVRAATSDNKITNTSILRIILIDAFGVLLVRLSIIPIMNFWHHLFFLQ